MKLFIIATIVVVLSLFESSFGENDFAKSKTLMLSDFYGDLKTSELITKATRTKPVIYIRAKKGGLRGKGRLRSGRKNRRRSRGRGRGKGKGRLPVHFKSNRLPLPPLKLLFSGTGLKYDGLGGSPGYAAGLGGGLGFGIDHELDSLGGDHGIDIGSNYGLGSGLGGALSLGSGDLFNGQVKGIEYDSLFDEKDVHSSSVPLKIGVGDVKGDVVVQEFRDGEVIRCDEYDGGYELIKH